MSIRIALVVCTVGRAGTVEALLPWIARLDPQPSETVFVVTKPEDLPETVLRETLPEATVLYSEKGLPKQRNRGLDLVQARSDAIFFIDDDYLPARNALAGIARAMAAFPEAAGFSGRLLADGIHTGGISADEATALLTAYESRGGEPVDALRRGMVGLYGCNMAYRSEAIGTARFDECLPLYAWQEDVDFASRLRGEKIRTGAFAGVHCGTNSGRETSGHLLGYSQIVNPVYLMRKGSLPAGFALKLIARTVLSNHLKLLRPEPWIDRKGRARGNWIALLDLVKGIAAPERILEMLRP